MEEKNNSLDKNDSTIPADYVHYLHSHPVETIVLLTVLCFLIVFGTCGNLLIITAIGITKQLRNRTHNYFVVNLAICDLIIAGFLNSSFVATIVMGEKWFSVKSILCGSIGFVCMSSCLASLALVAIIAINRYIGICRSEIAHKVFNKRNTIIINIFVWIYSLWLNIAVLKGWGEYIYDRKAIGCVWNRKTSRAFTLTFLAGVFVPITIVTICYSLIFYNIYKTKKMLQAHDKSNTSRLMDREIKIAKVLFIIFIMFMIMNSPYVLVIAADPFDRWPVVVYVVVVQLMHANASGVNCIIYGLTHKAFAQGYRKVFYGLFRKCGYSEDVDDSTLAESKSTKLDYVHTDGNTVGQARSTTTMDTIDTLCKDENISPSVSHQCLRVEFRENVVQHQETRKNTKPETGLNCDPENAGKIDGDETIVAGTAGDLFEIQGYAVQRHQEKKEQTYSVSF
ncbi:unnamed protein product [Owenia fusiformis]|uniref:G-protein coupled receptors family 1 profile domain-containing protein n=1 Tax=Owenia fusiformis TaxID=6347 RepID=A0A8S4N840_OWEFU|nr:unnamed protein product [Owenia fusiformis]